MRQVQPTSRQGRHIFIVSDATGKTCELVVKAALTQFETSQVVLHRMQYVRNEAQVQRVIDDARRTRGIVVYTLVSPQLRKTMLKSGLRNAVPTIDILGPILTRLTDLLEISPLAIPGLFRYLDEGYYRRIESIDFTVKHDDGLRPNDLSEADIVLVGVSRTSKTPISVYLSYRGYRVANLPIILGIEPPSQLFTIDPHKIVGLTIHHKRLQAIRQARARHLPSTELGSYVDLEEIRKELVYCHTIFQRQKWRVIDVTSKSIEESATEIMELMGERDLQHPRPEGGDLG